MGGERLSAATTRNLRLATQLGQSARKIDDDVAARDRLILKARANGMSLRAIGDAAGMSYQTVANIAERETS